MRYTNYLEPLINQVNRGPFTDSEKNYIYEWVSSRLKDKDSDMIRWELLQNEIQKEYGQFRLRNDLKYQWNCKRRQISRKCITDTEYLSTLHEDDERTPQSNLTEEKINCMEPLVGKVNHDPFSESEKSYIYEDCDVFRRGKFCLRNYLKYQWNRMRRQISRLYNTPNTEYLPILNEDDERTPQSNLTEEKINCMDPFVCIVNHDPFSYSEKSYIYEDCDVIRWELLQSKIQRKYGKLRNALKSKWNRKKRQISRHIFFLIL
ncbi:uncharacterized protein OCT59_003589 [Rhizophagus irregularis]|uniref:Uncharacterized protein n=3 Tax=Rhizophagus irregularis TaxID=588596 RepID=A0A015NE22_RHIIW|nr:hypothetical protein GLOIN_2v1482814 [Rhizophagus irregularis DAOM 181602=DAOM 197198]EXX77533.1 hypothetical protein RirG_022860 [Rhizophagus irregularis DAOM 197198w]POG65800.1 hypothetical protein GLOIN_2v1482814 [Rhizophagus irregularis DAOM 181602=DAOM 197198]UZO12039.1 hypothetical protein OCT59_003589 [Rhizophagus irregularis]GBC37581.2 hypothetical protein GLOIN_2v1482814 [Rhizophagus irregularis DAOM 181602=DAOM 197198]|eukprot:XP_025172666.1 hypothetical protein GLOIN_2v1482814 [Rhizophagus irregularis DAOM 181602=DAOM 197198]